MKSEEIYKCDECGDRFLKFSIDSFDVCDFDHIIQVEGEFCKGCIYKMLYEHYHRGVVSMREFVESW